MYELMGIAGIALSVFGYVPQVVHLAKEHCAAGVSTRAWTIWLVSGVLVGTVAVHRHDAVFMLLQFSSLTSASIILFLSRRYEGMACESHAHLLPDPSPVIAVEPTRTVQPRELPI